MIKTFLKRNWLYVALLSFIILLNALPFFEKEEKLPLEKGVEAREEKPREIFVDFDEAQERTEKIEVLVRGSLPLYLFYISMNLLIIFIFLVGLAVDGSFLYSIYKKKKFFKKTHNVKPPPWTMADVFRIVILAVGLGYVFFIGFGLFVRFLESFNGTEFKFYESENFRMVFDTIVLDLIVFFIIIRFLRKFHKKRLISLGFNRKNMGRNILYGVTGYVGVIPIIFMIGIVVYMILNVLKLKAPPQPIVGLFLAEKNVTLIFVSSIIAGVFGPIIEEIFFRGVMYNAVKKKMGVFWGIFITSVLFSFLHTHAASYFLVGFIPIAILGAALAYLYEKTGSLIPSITLHMLNNVGSVIMVFTFKYFNNLVR